jgi:hypothetical protein
VPNTCIFCGHRGPNSDFPPEHWVPEWLNRELFPHHASGAVHNIHGRSWSKARFDLTVKHVCGTCNHGWMSQMESDARPHVSPLIHGLGGLPRDADDQRLVASYCFLKALSLELGRPKDEQATYPPGLYRGLKEYRHPPYLGCSIAIGARETSVETEPTYIWLKSLGQRYDTDGPPATTTDGYRTYLLLGHLVLDVAGVFVAAQAVIDHGDRMVKIWPDQPGDTVQWPPAGGRFIGISNNELV